MSNKVNELYDTYGRKLQYLRISVTDRCNFRCKYCKPNNDFKSLECEDILRYEDILFTAKTFATLGVNRIRITGGEPLVRKGIIEFLSYLTKIENIDEVMVTTNGALLHKYAQDLYNAGVKRLNISLDSLQGERNKYITGFDKTKEILEGIKLASSIGIKPVKVNTVIIRGFNDDEIEDFAKLSAEYNVICRFIEFMPIGNSDNWGQENIVYGDEIIKRLSHYEPLELKKDKNAGPAVNYKLNNGGTIGIITPMSKHFCSECDKLRLTSDGKIRPCLLSDNEVDIKEIIKERNEEKLINKIIESLNLKKNQHNITDMEQKYDFKRTMSKIGG